MFSYIAQRQHKPALESQYLAKPSYSNSSNDSNINHRQERRSDHHWQCETMAESGFAPELQGGHQKNYTHTIA